MGSFGGYPSCARHGCKPLKIDEEYIIVSVLTGGGNVYLADLGKYQMP
ncbi:hypothetical protein H5410_017610 [Solanum commersonii]|uniref:Uncharacterized protein n=1 Tax=Solanum commersonii TaxID=4109 RepID=A0A9J6A0H7_SOLCO|nr:hypothetical protein H5410_017610 [Solanum commersonii]